MPAVGLAVRLRMLSAPAPRVCRPTDLDALQNLGRVLRLDEAELQIRAGGDLDVAGREFLATRRDFAELEGFQRRRRECAAAP